MMDTVKRPKVAPGITPRRKTGCGWLYMTINEFDGEPMEIFIKLGKAGGCMTANLEALGRMISVALRCGMPVEMVIKHLKGIECPSKVPFPDDKKAMSCPDAIARMIEEYLSERKTTNEPVQRDDIGDNDNQK